MRAPDSKKNETKPWLKEQWCIPPKANGAFVAAMENILKVYHRPYDPLRPLVCLDECSRQLIEGIFQPLPVRPGHTEKYDHEYKRKGMVNLFMIYAPLEGWRHVEVTQRRTKIDWAHCVRRIVDEFFPEAEKIILVEDNLNTHALGSLYDAFEPQEASRIADKLELQFTPKHGSWLNMAEIELSVLQKQCLKRRIPTENKLSKETMAWEMERNQKKAGTNWRFDVDNARIKLKRLYPSDQC